MGTPRDSGRPATGSVRGVKCPAHVAQAGTDLMLVRPCSWSRTVMPTCRLTFKGRTLAIGGVGPRDGGCLRCSAARTAPGRPRSRCPWSVALTRRQVMHSVGQGPVHVPCRRKRPRSRWFTLGVRRLRCVGRFAAASRASHGSELTYGHVWYPTYAHRRAPGSVACNPHANGQPSQSRATNTYM